MATGEKVLWVVNYESLEEFIDKAIFVKATAVAIRTDNDLVKAIPAFNSKGIKVYGWRWPSAKRDAAMRAVDLLSCFYDAVNQITKHPLSLFQCEFLEYAQPGPLAVIRRET